MLEHLLAEWGFAGLAERVPADCFKRGPTFTSALKFLRKNEWARLRVEEAYVQQIEQENKNPLLRLYRESGEWPAASEATAETQLSALFWLIRHHDGHEEALRAASETLDDASIWPKNEEMPLLNTAIEHGAPPWLLRRLLAKGADASDDRYWPPLLHTTDVEGRRHEAGEAPNAAVLDLLLQRGAHPEQRDRRSTSALQIAQHYRLRSFLQRFEAAHEKGNT